MFVLAQYGQTPGENTERTNFMVAPSGPGTYSLPQWFRVAKLETGKPEESNKNVVLEKTSALFPTGRALVPDRPNRACEIFLICPHPRTFANPKIRSGDRSRAAIAANQKNMANTATACPSTGSFCTAPAPSDLHRPCTALPELPEVSAAPSVRTRVDRTLSKSFADSCTTLQ